MANKPTLTELREDHHWIYAHFYKNGLLDKYCIRKGLMYVRTLKDAKEAFKKIYGKKKPRRWTLENEHQWLFYHLKRNKLLDKYCQPSKRKTQYTLAEAKNKFKLIYGDKKIKRSIIRKENKWMYGHFRRRGLLDEYTFLGGRE